MKDPALILSLIPGIGTTGIPQLFVKNSYVKALGICLVILLFICIISSIIIFVRTHEILNEDNKQSSCTITTAMTIVCSTFMLILGFYIVSIIPVSYLLKQTS